MTDKKRLYNYPVSRFRIGPSAPDRRKKHGEIRHAPSDPDLVRQE
jgi:hypothetical protein